MTCCTRFKEPARVCDRELTLKFMLNLCHYTDQATRLMTTKPWCDPRKMTSAHIGKANVGVLCHFHCKNSTCRIKHKTKTAVCFVHKKSSSHFECRDSRLLCGTGGPDGGRGVCPPAGSMFNSVWGTNKVMSKVNPSLQTIIIINTRMTM